MGMIAVAETTTPARAAAIRARLMGTPPPPKKVEIRYEAPRRKVYQKNMIWSSLSTEERCGLIREAWFDGVTSREISEKIESVIGEKVARYAILATFYRHSDGLLQGIKFTSQGGGNGRPRVKTKKARVWIDNTRIGQLKQLLSEDRKSVDTIINVFCEWQGVSFETLKSMSRAIIHARPRQKLMWLLAKHTKLSSVQIAEKIGGRDHTTALHSIRKIDRLIAADDPSVADLKGWVS